MSRCAYPPGDVDYQAFEDLCACCVHKSEVSIDFDTGTTSEVTKLNIHGSQVHDFVGLLKNAVEDAKLRRERGARGAIDGSGY
eukprot:scaffold491423_cov50-Prasinocladus_malaysianus.AAC.1